MHSSLCAARTFSLALGAWSLLTSASLWAQATVHHPTITSVSPRNPTPGQTVTITGTDLKVPTWTIVLQYEDKYGSSTLRELTLSGSNTALTFAAPTDLRPDSIAIQYSNGDQTNRLENPIPLEEQRHVLPPIQVQKPPALFDTMGTTATGGGGSFNVLVAGSRTVSGKDLLKTPTSLKTSFSLGLSKSLLQIENLAFFSSAPANAPDVHFAGTALSVSSAKYVTHLRDEIVISTASIAHNTTGYVSVTTPAGADSVRLTVVRPPQSARVVDLVNTGAVAVTNGQLIRGRQYQIRGLNLVVRQQSSPNSFNVSTPTVTFSGATLNLLNTVSVFGGLNDTTVLFTVPLNANGLTSGALSLSHAGGTVNLGNFTVINQPTALNVSGAVISPSVVIGGTTATLTVSLNPTPTNFSLAGSLTITIPAPTLGAAIPPINPVQITSNPMTISVPTNAVSTTFSGNITVTHSTQGALSSSVSVTVRPPQPTAITVTPDTIPGGTSAPATVSFDLAGPATVLLSSSDPSIASVPASATRVGSTAAFAVTTQPVTTPHPITFTAALNGVTATRTIVVVPGRLTTLVVSPTTLIGGEPGNATLTFSVPVNGAAVTLASSDTAVRVSGSTTVTGASRQIGFTTSNALVNPVSVTLSATAGDITRTAVVQVNPIQISQFTVAPTSGVGGTTLAATLRLSRPALRSHSLDFSSSDTTVATVAPFGLFNIGEDTKVVSVTLRGPQTSARTATITVKLLAVNNGGSPVISTKTVTVTATP